MNSKHRGSQDSCCGRGGGTRRRGVVMSFGALKGAGSRKEVQPIPQKISEFFGPEMVCTNALLMHNVCDSTMLSPQTEHIFAGYSSPPGDPLHPFCLCL